MLEGLEEVERVTPVLLVPPPEGLAVPTLRGAPSPLEEPTLREDPPMLLGAPDTLPLAWPALAGRSFIQ